MLLNNFLSTCVRGQMMLRSGLKNRQQVTGGYLLADKESV